MPASLDRQHEAETKRSAGTPWRFGRYLAVVLLLPLVFFLLTFPLAASHGFLRISRRSLWHAAEYRFETPAQQNCDVVIAGDSSGMIDVDPRVIAASTGWTTCNLALPYVSTALAGTRVLDRYLTRNRPPRFIVFHLSNNHLRPPALDEENGIVDGWLMVDEHFPLTEKLRLFAAHPLDTVRFVVSVWKGFLVTQPILRPDWSGATYQADMQEQTAERGWMEEPGNTAWIICGWQTPSLSTDRTYLDQLVSRYTRNGTRAVIWPSPARDCDTHLAQYRTNAMMLGLPPTPVYDRALFFDAFHLNSQGAARNAAELARYLESLNKR